jgi:ectoine hydroxylase-related dioxygenase (phytanoyl-CoA dioxygenase family)
MSEISGEFDVSNDLLADSAALRARLEEQGYLFLRDVAPKQRVREVRREILEILESAGWLEKSAPLMEGIWSGVGPYAEGEAEYMAVYREVLHAQSFVDLPADERFMRLMERIVQGPVQLHRRRIGRITFPNNTQQTTAAHQDFHYIRGTEQTYTLWLPIGDCPIQLGGLAVIPRSHRSGFIEHRLNPEKKYAGHGLGEDQLPVGSRWHASDFELGDVLIFHSHTIHKALPNLMSNRLRLSADNRYQLAGSAIEAGSMGTHYNL